MHEFDFEALTGRVKSGDHDAFVRIDVVKALLEAPDVDRDTLNASEALLRALLAKLPELQQEAIKARALDNVPLGPSQVDLLDACVLATRNLQAGLREGYKTVGGAS